MTPKRLALDHEAFTVDKLRPSVKEQLHAVETTPGQILRVIEVDARPDEGAGYEHTVVWPAAFQARADYTNIERMRILAEQLQAKALFVETPGVPVDIDNPQATYGAHTTREQARAALRGDLRPHAAAQLQALHEAVPFEDGEQLHIIGYSMGATTAAHMVQQIGEQPFSSDGVSLRIARVDFIDPANDQGWNRYKLLKAIKQEGKADKAYINENKALGLEPNAYGLATEHEAQRMRKRLERQQLLGIYSVALGLKYGFSPILQQAINESREYETSRLHEADITFYRANASLVGRESAHQHTADELRKCAKFALRRVELTKPNEEALHHAFPRCFGRFAHLAQQDYLKHS